MFNELQDAQEFLLDPPTCKVRRTTSSNVTSANFTTLSWSEAVEDNCKPFGVGYTTAMWDPTGNNWEIKARVAGWYELTYTVVWASRTDDARRMQFVEINDGADGVRWGRRDVWQLNNETIVNAQIPVFLNVGDYVTLVLFHQLGVTTSVGGPGPETGRYTQMKLKWVSL